MSRRVLITGGAGFIGCNLAAELLRSGDEVVVLDDLSRRGSPENLHWLQGLGAVRHLAVDVSDAAAVARGFEAAGPVHAVFHLAAQVAVTSSVADPRRDFEVNALGTLNVLEAVRASGSRPLVVFSSTNKVYGGLEDLALTLSGGRHWPADAAHARGIDEARPLDLHSPYGCSKGAADQYVRDYARIYGLRTVVLRQSCIYGPRQLGVEDQGWLAWFVIAALLGRPITIYGDGHQVRDLLEVSDLVRLYRRCLERADELAGLVLNVGGGPGRTLSVGESLDLLERELGRPITRRRAPSRPGDQRYFVACVDEASRRLDWQPQVGVEEGLARLAAWVRENLELIAGLLGADGPGAAVGPT